MNHLSPEEVAHLLSSVSALSARMGSSFSEALRHLIALAESADPKSMAVPRDRRDFARRVLRVRQQRNVILGADSFRDPAWDMLLDLYVQDSGHAGTMISALCAEVAARLMPMATIAAASAYLPMSSMLSPLA